MAGVDVDRDPVSVLAPLEDAVPGPGLGETRTCPRSASPACTARVRHRAGRPSASARRPPPGREVRWPGCRGRPRSSSPRRPDRCRRRRGCRWPVARPGGPDVAFDLDGGEEAVLPVPPADEPSCQFVYGRPRGRRSAPRIQVPLPTSEARVGLPGREHAGRGVAGGSVDAGAGGFTSSRTVPSPVSGPTVTSTAGTGGCGNAGDRPGQAAAEASAVKSDASTPPTASLNVTRNTIVSALPRRGVGFCG